MVFRTNKTNDFSIISNAPLRERKMSLQAKGLLMLMLSNNDGWNYSMNGLKSICIEKDTAINSALKELKKFGYLKVTKLMPNQTESKRIEYVYDIFEMPQGRNVNDPVLQDQPTENQGVGNQPLENQPLEFQGLEIQGTKEILYKEKSNKERSNEELSNTGERARAKKSPASAPTRHKHGEYQNVLLSDEELSKLNEEYGEDVVKIYIERVSSYMASKGATYKNFLATIRNWIKRDAERAKNNNVAMGVPQEEGTFWERVDAIARGEK